MDTDKFENGPYHTQDESLSGSKHHFLYSLQSKTINYIPTSTFKGYVIVNSKTLLKNTYSKFKNVSQLKHKGIRQYRKQIQAECKSKSTRLGSNA